MKKMSLCFLLVILFLVGCSNTPKDEEQDETPEQPVLPEKGIYLLGAYGDYVKYIDETKDTATLEGDYQKLTEKVKGEKNGVFQTNYSAGLLDFFSIEQKIKLVIDIEEAELKKLNEDYKTGNKESYRICNLDILMGELQFHYEQVGIRQKGNTSRGAILDDHGKINLRHYKLSFTATFDDEFTKTPMEWKDEAALEYRDNRNFFGIEKLNIRWNRNQEQTYLREYYAFEVYRNNGVLAPHSNPMQVEMKTGGTTQNLGVYLAVEDIDKSFIKRNLVKASAGGDLYKMGWTSVGARLDSLDSSLFGVEKQIIEGEAFKQVTYPYDLKTNKKTSQHQQIKSFIEKILNTETSQFDSVLTDAMIYEYTIRYLAVSYLLGDPDDLRGNSNNTYLYFLEDTQQAIFIPTDHDRALGSTGGSGNPTNHHGALNQPFDDTTGYAQNTTPFYTKALFVGGNQKIKQSYLEEIQKIVDGGWLETSTFASYFEKAKKNYAASTTLGSKVNGKNVTFSMAEETDPAAPGNLSIDVYLSLKKRTFTNFNWNPGEEEEVSYSSFYLRCQMNDWNGISKEYCLKILNGVPSLEIYLEANQPFKIADSSWNKEFNYDSVVDTALVSSIGDEKNIGVKESGLYRIEIIDANTDHAKLSIRKK